MRSAIRINQRSVDMVRSRTIKIVDRQDHTRARETSPPKWSNGEEINRINGKCAIACAWFMDFNCKWTIGRCWVSLSMALLANKITEIAWKYPFRGEYICRAIKCNGKLILRTSTAVPFKCRLIFVRWCLRHNCIDLLPEISGWNACHVNRTARRSPSRTLSGAHCRQRAIRCIRTKIAIFIEREIRTFR